MCDNSIVHCPSLLTEGEGKQTHSKLQFVIYIYNYIKMNEIVDFFLDQIVATLLCGDQCPVCSSVRGWQLRCQSQDKLINKYFNTSTRYFWTGRYCDIHCWQNWSKVVIVMLSSIKDSLKMFSSGLWKGSLQKTYTHQIPWKYGCPHIFTLEKVCIKRLKLAFIPYFIVS